MSNNQQLENAIRRMLDVLQEMELSGEIENALTFVLDPGGCKVFRAWDKPDVENPGMLTISDKPELVFDNNPEQTIEITIR